MTKCVSVTPNAWDLTALYTVRVVNIAGINERFIFKNTDFMVLKIANQNRY